MVGSAMRKRRRHEFDYEAEIRFSVLGVIMLSKPAVRIFIFKSNKSDRHLIFPPNPNIFQKIFIYLVLVFRQAEFAKQANASAIHIFPRNAKQIFKW